MSRHPIHQSWNVDRSDDASRIARSFVIGALEPHASPETIRDAALLTSELVSNVMRHTDGPCLLTLRFDPDDAWVHIGVTDGEPDRHPVVVDRQPHTIGGFGLRLVQEVASRWGSTHEPTSKTVWFQLGDSAAG